MGQDTKIQWAHHTFNPWRGCTKVAEGCKNCYADAQSKRNPGVLGIWGPKGTRVVASETAWDEPRKWDKAAADAGERRRVFCASLADVFEDWRGPMIDHRGKRLYGCPRDHWWASIMGIEDCGLCDRRTEWLTMDDVRRHLFALIDATPHLDWLLVTKRPENIRKMWLPREVYECGCVRCCDGEHAGRCPDCAGWGDTDGEECSVCDSTGECPYCEGEAKPPTYRDNVWLLTSIACQEDADKNIPELLKCRDLVPVLGVSAEPLIGPVDLNWVFDPMAYACCGGDETCYGNGRCPVTSWPRDEHGQLASLDWVIAGGESGRNARPCNVEWIRSIAQQCRDAEVACFVKQLGQRVRCASVSDFPVGTKMRCPGHEADPSELYAPILADIKGGDPSEWPEDLRVRDFPEVGP